MVELDSAGELSTSEVAQFFRQFADEIDGNQAVTGHRPDDEGLTQESTHGETDGRRRMTLIVGGDSATVTVPDRMEFEIDVGSRSPLLGSGVNQEVDINLSWQVENPEDLNEDWLEVE